MLILFYLNMAQAKIECSNNKLYHSSNLYKLIIPYSKKIIQTIFLCGLIYGL